MQERLPTSDDHNIVSLKRSGAPRIAVIGGGFSGIAAAYYLKRAKLNDFVVFESESDLGGTWNRNRYPGAEVDIVSHLYCFTFNKNDWSQRYASREELKDYLVKTVDEFNLRPHFRFNTTVVAAEWSDQGKNYTVSFADGRKAEFEIVVSCVGFLNVPLIPEGIDLTCYPGVACHTSYWPDGIRLDGKRVGIIGTGSSAVQVVTEAAKVARQVTVFQRSPNWVFPKKNRLFTPEQRARYGKSWQYRFKFSKEFVKYERVKIFGKQEQPGSKTNRRVRDFAEDFLHRTLAGRPDLIEKLTPDYPYYGKRPVVSDTYLEAIRMEHVTIAPAVARMDADGLVDEQGHRHDLDLVVLATGFRAADYLSRLKVTGRNGADLHAVWKGEPAAFLGSCVPGFPNFFMLHGPNTNSGPLVFLLECQAKFAADSVAAMMRGGGTSVEVTKSAFDSFNVWVQKRLEASVFKSTRNYYSSPSGRIVTQWPFSATRFWWLSKTKRRSSMKIR